MRRFAVSFAVALLVVLAGCSLPGGSGQSTPSESVTPAPVPDVGAGPPAATEIPIGGIAEDSMVSPAELARAHRRALDGRALRIRELQNWTTTGVEVTDRRVRRNATLVVLADGRFRHDEERVTTYFRSGDVRTAGESVFANETRRLERRTLDGNSTYYRLGPDERPGSVLWNTSTLVRQYLSVETVTVDRITWAGEQHYRIVGRGAAGTVYSLTTDYTVRAIVQDDGMVRRLTVRYVESPIGRERRVVYRLTVDPIRRDRLDPPDWLSKARNLTAAGGN